MESLIDYGPAQHGHFLEYMINRFIYNINIDMDFFDMNGTCDIINLNDEYKSKRMVVSNHFTKLNIEMTADKVIIINHTPTLKFDFILLGNLLFKAGLLNNYNAISTHDIESRIKDLKNDRKINWYDKLQSRSFYEFVGMTSKFNDTFPVIFESFFSLNQFISTMQRISVYLEEEFHYDDSFIEIWDEFIRINQGYQLYLEADKLLNHIVRGDDVELVDDWKIHAYLNLQITKMFDIWDGPLFKENYYPTNTKEVYNIIQEHINEKV